MLELWLIRHGMTEGNKYGRYIGVTDETLCEEGIHVLKYIHYPEVEKLYVSPLRRCRESAQILYPGMEQTIVAELAECNFGDFENKNYKELAGNLEYQKWIDSNGMLPFPNGESKESFQNRVVAGFEMVVGECIHKNIKKAALVVHGGTIMSIMEAFADDKRNYYEWHVKNGERYHIRIDEMQWLNGERKIEISSLVKKSGENSK